MLKREERIVQGFLLGGFLSAEIAWHAVAYNKLFLLHWQTWMDIAGAFWLLAFIFFYWYKRETILQEEIRGIPPWYYFMLGVPFGIYAAITPWLLLTILRTIPVPLML